MEDTLDDENWHEVARRSVTPVNPKGVIRVSAPLGVKARLGLQVVVGGQAPGYGYACAMNRVPRRTTIAHFG